MSHSQSSPRSTSRILSAVAATGLLLALVGCTGEGGGTNTADTSASGCAVTASGDASSEVKVSGKLGAEPKVDIPSKLTSKTTERSVAIEGKGREAEAGSTVTIDYSAYNTTDGKKIDATPYEGEGTKMTLDEANLLPGLYKALHCSKPGSRVVAVMPPADLWGSAGSPQLGVSGNDSLVFVIDVIKTAAPVKVLAKADGTPQKPKAGFPTVTLADDGEPTISIPKKDAPKKLQIEVLKKGSGATVKAGAEVTVHYTGVLWDTGKEFDSSWKRGSPATFTTTRVVSGFGKAMVGQTVGSQIVAVIPPAEGYGDKGDSTGAISGTDTMVFVIDILAVR